MSQQEQALSLQHLQGQVARLRARASEVFGARNFISASIGWDGEMWMAMVCLMSPSFHERGADLDAVFNQTMARIEAHSAESLAAVLGIDPALAA